MRNLFVIGNRFDLAHNIKRDSTILETTEVQTTRYFTICAICTRSNNRAITEKNCKTLQRSLA